MPLIDLNEWLKQRGIDPTWGHHAAREIGQHYPTLAAALKKYPAVEGELEVVALAHDLLTKKLSLDFFSFLSQTKE